MGAWGCGAFDNDAALDHFWVITKDIAKVFDEKKPYNTYQDMRVAARLLVSANELHRVDQELLVKARDALVSIVKDDEWMSSWRSRKDILKEMTAELAAVEKLLE